MKPIAFINTTTESIPPFAVVQMGGLQTISGRRYVEGHQYQTDDTPWFVNGPTAVPSRDTEADPPVSGIGHGRSIFDPQWIRYEGDEAPATGDDWGPVSGSWGIGAEGDGVVIADVEEDAGLAYASLSTKAMSEKNGRSNCPCDCRKGISSEACSKCACINETRNLDLGKVYYLSHDGHWVYWAAASGRHKVTHVGDCVWRKPDEIPLSCTDDGAPDQYELYVDLEEGVGKIALRRVSGTNCPEVSAEWCLTEGECEFDCLCTWQFKRGKFIRIDPNRVNCIVCVTPASRVNQKASACRDLCDWLVNLPIKMTIEGSGLLSDYECLTDVFGPPETLDRDYFLDVAVDAEQSELLGCSEGDCSTIFRMQETYRKVYFETEDPEEPDFFSVWPFVQILMGEDDLWYVSGCVKWYPSPPQEGKCFMDFAYQWSTEGMTCEELIDFLATGEEEPIDIPMVSKNEDLPDATLRISFAPPDTPPTTGNADAGGSCGDPCEEAGAYHKVTVADEGETITIEGPFTAGDVPYVGECCPDTPAESDFECVEDGVYEIPCDGSGDPPACPEECWEVQYTDNIPAPNCDGEGNPDTSGIGDIIEGMLPGDAYECYEIEVVTPCSGPFGMVTFRGKYWIPGECPGDTPTC